MLTRKPTPAAEPTCTCDWAPVAHHPERCDSTWQLPPVHDAALAPTIGDRIVRDFRRWMAAQS